MRLVEPFLIVTSWLPGLTPAIMELVFTYGNLLPAYSQVGPSHEILVPQPYFPGNEQTEIGIPVKYCAEGLKQLRYIVVDNHIPANLITEVPATLQVFEVASYPGFSQFFSMMLAEKTREPF